MAAVCLMMQFATMDRAKYDDVMKALDWQNTGSPKGLISHMAGPTPQGWGVVDVWESQADFDRFLETHLRQAFEQARARMPEMQLTVFEVHNRYP
jgi:quinol monooxygenase YgiN